MTESKNGSTVVMNYVYNGKGEQVRKYLSTTNTYSLYDEAGHWLADYSNATTPTQQVIWMGDLPVGVLVGSGASQVLHYIEPDALDTPRVIVDRTRGANGTAIWNWPLEGEAFGNTAPNQNPDGDANQLVFNMRFPGQRFDSASGLNYNYFRDYSPPDGRYVQSDPIGLRGGVSTYSYAYQNSLLWTDEKGLAVVTNGNGASCGDALGITTCDGNGNLETRNCNKSCTSACTQMHENDHARFLGKKFPGSCKNKPRGSHPWPESLPYEQYLLLNARLSQPP